MTTINCELNSRLYSCRFNKEGRCTKDEITIHWDGCCVDRENKSKILMIINPEKHAWSLVKKTEVIEDV